jgi:hypothetical protein
MKKRRGAPNKNAACAFVTFDAARAAAATSSLEKTPAHSRSNLAVRSNSRPVQKNAACKLLRCPREAATLHAPAALRNSGRLEHCLTRADARYSQQRCMRTFCGPSQGSITGRKFRRDGEKLTKAMIFR